MKSMMLRTTFREIKLSFGRYIAIFSIIALGVGFFAGLKVTRTAMISTTNQYIKDLNLFDYRVISSLGLTESDVDSFSNLPAVEYAEGAYYADAIIEDSGREYVSRIHSYSEKLNKLSIVEGRKPENDKECIADARYHNASVIGKKIKIADSNSTATKGQFVQEEYTIVGIAYSSIYLNYERGTSSVGNGQIASFYYFMPEAFKLGAYTDIYITLNEKCYLYSKEYDDLIAANKEDIENTLKSCADERYSELVAFMPQGIESPSLFTLTRESNIGYVCFENDSGIVEGIAVVFPVFFFLVAALVCVTTMNRMIEEQRTQIGILKALGYGKSSIMGKYMIYSGSAAISGCVGGFFLGCYVFPKVIWIVYDLMYGFTEIYYIFDWKLFVLSIIVSLICSIGTTWLSLRHELSRMASELIRPKAPKNGKRIIFERITPLWKRLKFLQKVSIRNVVRYKKRFFMMVLGISGCTGLIIAGYGIKDSIANIADKQYGEIQIYDEQVSLVVPLTEKSLQEFSVVTEEKAEHIMPAYHASIDIYKEDKAKAITLVVPYTQDRFDEFIDLHTVKGKKISFPEYGEVVLTENIAEKLHIKKGDTVTFRDAEMHAMTLTVSDICSNYFYTYGYVSKETYGDFMKKAPEFKIVYINIAEGTDLHEAAAFLTNLDNVSAVNVNQDTKDMFSKMMESLNYIVVMVIVCAAALAFIVLYNLTNINITERLREIATIKVLGFYSGETATYVFRENMVLTVIGAFVGFPLGIALHGYVMYNIDIDMIRFDINIKPMSFVYAILFTLAFAVVVDFVMYFKIKRINMAESLKSVE